MFVPDHKEVRKIRHEFFVPNKATAKDLYDTIHAVNQALVAQKGKGADQWDDSFHVRADDEGIVLYFDVKETI